MHINLESDYAVRIMQCLAGATGKLEAQAISDRTGVSLRFTLKIMRKLVVAELVRSYKGVHGGYELARPPGQINLRQVIEAVEGPYHFSRCLEKGYSCVRPGDAACPFQKVYGEITKLVTDKLETVTFDILV